MYVQYIQSRALRQSTQYIILVLSSVGCLIHYLCIYALIVQCFLAGAERTPQAEAGGADDKIMIVPL